MTNWYNEFRRAIKALRKVSEQFVRRVAPLVLEGYRQGFEAANDAYGLGLDFRDHRAEATKFAKEYSYELIRTTLNKTTISRLRTLFATAIREGAGIPEVQRAISQIFRGTVREIPYRARMIARTEIIRAQNKGMSDAYMRSNKVKGKEWRAAFDERTCPICSQLSGEQVTKDGVFSGGYFAPPAHPNCRCRIIPVMIDIPAEYRPPIPDTASLPPERPADAPTSAKIGGARVMGFIPSYMGFSPHSYFYASDAPYRAQWGATQKWAVAKLSSWYSQFGMPTKIPVKAIPIMDYKYVPPEDLPIFRQQGDIRVGWNGKEVVVFFSPTIGHRELTDFFRDLLVDLSILSAPPEAIRAAARVLKIPDDVTEQLLTHRDLRKLPDKWHKRFRRGICEDPALNRYATVFEDHDEFTKVARIVETADYKCPDSLKPKADEDYNRWAGRLERELDKASVFRDPTKIRKLARDWFGIDVPEFQPGIWRDPTRRELIQAFAILTQAADMMTTLKLNFKAYLALYREPTYLEEKLSKLIWSDSVPNKIPPLARAFCYGNGTNPLVMFRTDAPQAQGLTPIHEFAHAMHACVPISLIEKWAVTMRYKKIKWQPGRFFIGASTDPEVAPPTYYARANLSEDIAESLWEYVRNPRFFELSFPERAALMKDFIKSLGGNPDGIYDLNRRWKGIIEGW